MQRKTAFMEKAKFNVLKVLGLGINALSQMYGKKFHAVYLFSKTNL